MTTAIATQPIHDAPTTASKTDRRKDENTSTPPVFAMLFDTLKNYNPTQSSLLTTSSGFFSDTTGRGGTLVNEIRQQDIDHRNGSSRIALTQEGNQPLQESLEDDIETQAKAKTESQKSQPPTLNGAKPTVSPDTATLKPNPTIGKEASNSPNIKPGAIPPPPNNESSHQSNIANDHASSPSKPTPTNTTVASATTPSTPTPKPATATTQNTSTNTAKPAARSSADSAPAIQPKTKTASVRTAKTSQPVDTEAGKSNTERIARVIQAKIGKNETVARVRLDPPGMGNVNVHLRLTNNVLRVRLTTEKSHARSTLQAQSHDLRTALESHGYKIDRVDFPDANDTHASSDHQNPETDTKHGAPQQNDHGQNQHAQGTNASSAKESNQDASRAERMANPGNANTETVASERITRDRLDIKA